MTRVIALARMSPTFKSAPMSEMVVLDASAILCLLDDRPGAERVAGAITKSVIGTTALAEVVSSLRARGVPLAQIRQALGGLHLDVRPLTASQALVAGDLRPATSSLSLSISQRACLALAIEMQAELLTADPDLASAKVGITIADVRADP